MKPALVLAALVLLAIALAYRAPASLVDGRIAALTDGRVRVADAAGTVWNGSGDLVLLPKGTRRAIAWHLDAWPLVMGEARGNLAVAGNPAVRAEFAYGPHRTELRGFDFSLPVDGLLQSAGVPQAVLGAGGSLVAHVDRFVQTPQTIDADLSLQWRDASLPSLQPGLRIALGDIQAELRGNGAEAAGALANRGGDVDIAGRISVNAALAPRIDATVRPRAGLDRDRAEAIATALSLMGAPDGQGGYRLAWSGS
jgi:general secretion pathway protein N